MTARNFPPFTPGRPVGSRHVNAPEPRTVEVHDMGRWPETKLHTHDGDVEVRFTAPNGRRYSVRLDGNVLRVNSLEGGIYVRPKADNLVEIINVTPFEGDTDEALHG